MMLLASTYERVSDRALISVAYLVTLVHGIALMTTPGATIDRAIEQPGILITSGSIIIAGSLVAIVGIYRRRFWWERTAVIIIAVGMVPYVSAACFILVTSGSGAVRTLSALMVVYVLALRYVRCCRLAADLDALQRVRE